MKIHELTHKIRFSNYTNDELNMLIDDRAQTAASVSSVSWRNSALEFVRLVSY